MLAPSFLNGPFQQPFDQSVYTYWDDFTSHGITNALGAATTLASEHTWTMQQIGSNANCKVVTANPADGLHLGALGFNANGTGSGNGVTLYLGGGASSAGFSNPNTNTIIYKTAFQLSTNATVALFAGMVANNAQATPPNVNTSLFMGVRYDTTLSDANLIFATQTAGVAGNTWTDTLVPIGPTNTWHKVLIWTSGQGSAFCQVDNAAPVSSNTIPSGFMDYIHQFVTRATASPQINIDYIGIQATGLLR